MQRIRTAVLAASSLLVILPVLPDAAVAGGVAADFASDPSEPKAGAPAFEILAPAGSPFAWEPDSPSRFRGDPKGSVSAVYDSLAPTARFFTRLPGPVTQDDDFLFGAVLTIRADGFAPDPFGFHPIAFSLFNGAATGDDRTGDLSDFRSDTFDTVEMAWFPNVSPFFGGPFLSPTLFGERMGDDAFANFAFNSAVVALQPGVTYLIVVEHEAAARTLTIDVHTVRLDGRAVPLPGGRVAADLSGVTGFLADSLGLSAYFDGFNVFSSSGRSLYAVVDYDLLFAGVKHDGALPRDVEKALKRFTRAGRLTPSDPAQP